MTMTLSPSALEAARHLDNLVEASDQVHRIRLTSVDVGAVRTVLRALRDAYPQPGDNPGDGPAGERWTPDARPGIDTCPSCGHWWLEHPEDPQRVCFGAASSRLTIGGKPTRDAVCPCTAAPPWAGRFVDRGSLDLEQPDGSRVRHSTHSCLTCHALVLGIERPGHVHAHDQAAAQDRAGVEHVAQLADTVSEIGAAVERLDNPDGIEPGGPDPRTTPARDLGMVEGSTMANARFDDPTPAPPPTPAPSVPVRALHDLAAAWEDAARRTAGGYVDGLNRARGNLLSTVRAWQGYGAPDWRPTTADRPELLEVVRRAVQVIDNHAAAAPLAKSIGSLLAAVRTALPPACPDCADWDEDPLPWCDCRPGDEPCSPPYRPDIPPCTHRPCKKHAHTPDRCPSRAVAPAPDEPARSTIAVALDAAQLDVLDVALAALHLEVPSEAESDAGVRLEGALRVARTALGLPDTSDGRNATNRYDAMPDGLRDALDNLAGLFTGSTSGQFAAHLIDRYPGAAHAVHRVTRFADPPVDVYAHRWAKGGITVVEPAEQPAGQSDQPAPATPTAVLDVHPGQAAWPEVPADGTLIIDARSGVPVNIWDRTGTPWRWRWDDQCQRHGYRPDDSGGHVHGAADYMTTIEAVPGPGDITVMPVTHVSGWPAPLTHVRIAAVMSPAPDSSSIGETP